ncbi:MAG: hypothetical protein PHW03_07205 [Eubacteriales bacterium]|nr:hypothetical protein [Eubacteriales bacterium]MDD4390573.1 hypothetical protein [Eubacteriales bacterium]
MYNIQDISEMENALVISAPATYGKYFDNAYALVSFVQGFYGGSVATSKWIFLYFFNQLYNSLLLALLSTVRRHDVQAIMMLRQSLESVVFACYAAYNYKPEEFGEVLEDGTLDAKKLHKKAYPWFESKYASHSVVIKSYKHKINEHYAHSNILLTLANTEVVGNKIVSTFFDGSNEDPEHFEAIIKQRLCWIGDISLIAIDLFSQITDELKIADLIDDFEARAEKLRRDNQSLKEELAQHPIFSKWIKGN